MQEFYFLTACILTNFTTQSGYDILAIAPETLRKKLKRIDWNIIRANIDVLQGSWSWYVCISGVS